MTCEYKKYFCIRKEYIPFMGRAKECELYKLPIRFIK